MTPDVRVVRGEPDDVELAALVAGLAASASGHAERDRDHDHGATSPAEAAAHRWRAAAGPTSGPLVPGPDAWRWSGWR
ncbi:acyl-CoA carboxylase subunit epsilon [Actinotalea ferrariae]|uniref:acyl-CoA carboxylase epsilon subunit n=1 Tax=Actinotalea ferrariae TaxID=1386098 RepID=UPI001C8CDFEC|nr:acyl-CoA carboxylase epsilon subunit [Actinotalea ferrariae]MBX9245962.1 acyl-CoA carboxylase subunit epsilon [Actinotalea ferrariae]